MRLVFVGVLALAGLASGCGPSCQSACNRAFKESECNLTIPGVDQGELISDCISECNKALGQPGDLDGYDPNERQQGGESFKLENEKQAAVWMDCVEETACDLLDRGYCAGGGI